MFSHTPLQLTHATVLDWSGYRETKWLWRVTDSHSILSLGVNIVMSYNDLPVDVRNASTFGSWLLRRGDACWYHTGPGRAVPPVIAFCLCWCEAGLLGWGSPSPPAAPSSLPGPEHSLLCLRHCRCSPKPAASGLRIRQTVLQTVRVPFLQDFLHQWE